MGIQEEGLDFKRQESLARINAESIKSAQAHESTLGKQLVEFMTNSEGLPGQFVMESVKGLQRPFVEAVKRRGGTQEEAQALFEQHVAIGRAKSVTDGTPFTLGEGETRFGPDGQPIASVAPQPDKPPAPTHGEQLESGPGIEPNPVDREGPAQIEVEHGVELEFRAAFVVDV